MTACFPIDSDGWLTTNVPIGINVPGNQHGHAKAIDSVLKTGSPEDIVVRGQTERFCELQTYFWTDRHKIRGSEQTDSALAEVIARWEQRIQRVVSNK